MSSGRRCVARMVVAGLLWTAAAATAQDRHCPETPVLTRERPEPFETFSLRGSWREFQNILARFCRDVADCSFFCDPSGEGGLGLCEPVADAVTVCKESVDPATRQRRWSCGVSDTQLFVACACACRTLGPIVPPPAEPPEPPFGAGPAFPKSLPCRSTPILVVSSEHPQGNHVAGTGADVEAAALEAAGEVRRRCEPLLHCRGRDCRIEGQPAAFCAVEAEVLGQPTCTPQRDSVTCTWRSATCFCDCVEDF